jgi:galactose mutarotase-like enzyme
MTTLENDFLRVTTRSQGAELTSILHKPTGIEHLWQADTAVWGWHAPNLFPVVGGCLNNELLIDGKTYPMERHGFARKLAFDLLDSTPTTVVWGLTSGKQTEPHFPYGFTFQISYELIDEQLIVTYKVFNQDTKPVYFSVGAHPAFSVPFNAGESYSDYYIDFNQPEQLETHMLSTDGFFTGETRPVPLDGYKLHLNDHLFDQDALVFKRLNSRRVAIRSTKHTHSVDINFPDFPYLGIWAKPGAPFVCIEPWLGCADSEGSPKLIQQKEAIQHVDVGGEFNAFFTITFS